ncbi:hypothetical protein PFLG_00627 [Plasmodium falciparum RAJ116]|uniref:Uncharacterized protein n=1 Tax=Plasmodium falciparum RAJ116 TaxID=580058 RepID=A0A0L0CT31_PLAFA|nr:hypothetical protein PFLG_00627 [Plasmodium falciparum RAJ116]
MDIQRKIKKCITLKRKLKNPKGCLTNLKNKIIKCNVKDFQSTRNRYFFNIFEKIIKRYIFNNVMNTNRTNNFGIENISCTQYDKIKNIPYTCHNIKYDIHSCNNLHDGPCRLLLLADRNPFPPRTFFRSQPSQPSIAGVQRICLI